MTNQKMLEVSAVIIIDSKNRVLLQKKDSDYPLGSNKWSLFGGGIEKDENAMDAVQREIKEEIGISFNKEKIKFLDEFIFKGELNGKFFRVNHSIFIIEFNKDISEIRIGEGIGFAFFEKEELTKLDLMLPTKKILERFLKR